MSEAQKKIGNRPPRPLCGEKHWNWKGGKIESIKRWQAKNRDKVNFWRKNTEIKRKKAKGLHTFGEWENLKIQYNWTCPCCGKKEPEIKLTQDHIVPLIKGGSNWIENIQPLCFNCNCKKHTNIIFYINKNKLLGL
ncbi:MAG: HNH endonuclease [Atribacterota bacterium]|nr:HNH endonuclease [Atribacterota bacterium]